MEIPRVTEVRQPEAKELDVFARMSETQLLRAFEPERGLFVAEGVNVVLRALQAPDAEPQALLCERMLTEEEGRYAQAFPDREEPRVAGVEIGGFAFHPKIASVIRFLAEQEHTGVPVYCAPLSVLEQITGYHLTGGVLCAMRRPKLPDANTLLKDAHRVAVLDHVTNPTNVGAIFRNAAALGMDTVLLTRSCSDPLYRRALRTGMGSAFRIPWTIVADGESCIRLLHANGFRVCAMALTDDAVSVDDLHPQTEKLAIVLGNEGYGLPEETVHACDSACKIPMAHGVDSLNVASASAVAFYAMRVPLVETASGPDRNPPPHRLRRSDL